MQLVIVESPSKAKTIQKYLGKGYKVLASVGHVRDLPKSNKNAIDIDNGFAPYYVVDPKKQKVLSEITSAAKKADTILLAPDPDREGEAIAWHIAEILKENLGKDVESKLKRITFNAITKETVQEALKAPRSIDQKLRQAQEARRVLDRLIGYELSGLIWKKVRYGLSAGRVQSPALRIVMEREREIRAFNSEQYFLLHGTASKNKESFTVSNSKEFTNQEELNAAIPLLNKASWHVQSVKTTNATRKAKPPFTTSTLQQVASTRLGFSPSRTMRAAQKLYEGGHITYMRTDSISLSKQALGMIAGVVEKEFGKKLVNVTQYKSKKKNAQEAHEAVRPTNPGVQHAGKPGDEQKLYNLIWRRTIASQMVPAQIERIKVTTAPNIEIKAEDIVITLSANGSRITFDGWLLADPASKGEDVLLPKLTEGEAIDVKDIYAEEKWTQPPHRYTEAGLIKELEKRGIGRPSTYASIMRTLVQREYVLKEGRTLFPTPTGDVVSTFLEEHFLEYIDDDFTSEMEDALDHIAEGEKQYTTTLSHYYQPFHQHVQSKEGIEKLTNLGPADNPEHTCPECNAEMVKKLGRNGIFLSCERFPDCEGARTADGEIIGDDTPIGIDPKTELPIYVLNGRFGPYVQLGETPEKKSKQPTPRRASIPKEIDPKTITIEQALSLLELPRELGFHPVTNQPIIANIGRYGPYIGHGRDFRPLVKPDDPYTITYERAMEIYNTVKGAPKGAERLRMLGYHPTTFKQIWVFRSKSGLYVTKGRARLYFEEGTNFEKLELKDALELIGE